MMVTSLHWSGVNLGSGTMTHCMPALNRVLFFWNWRIKLSRRPKIIEPKKSRTLTYCTFHSIYRILKRQTLFRFWNWIESLSGDIKCIWMRLPIFNFGIRRAANNEFKLMWAFILVNQWKNYDWSKVINLKIYLTKGILIILSFYSITCCCWTRRDCNRNIFLLQMINQFFDTFFGLKHVDQLQVDQFKYKSTSKSWKF